MYAEKSNYGMVGQVGAFPGGVMQAAEPYRGESATRKSEVQDELDRLAIALESLDKTAEILAQRLQPVRRQTGALTGNNQTSAPEPVLCDMAAIIRGRRQVMERVVAGLQQVLGELEV